MSFCRRSIVTIYGISHQLQQFTNNPWLFLLMRLTYEETTSYAHFFSFIKGKKIPCYYQLISCDRIWTCVSASSTHTHAVNEFYPINIEGLIVKEWSRSKRKTYQKLSIFNCLFILKCYIMIFCQKATLNYSPSQNSPW